MKKFIFSSALLIVGLAATSALASTISDEWHEIFPTNTVADGSQRTGGGTGPAYWLWTEDAERTIWNVSWTGDTDLYNFTGKIYLENTSGSFQTIDFEYGGEAGDILRVNGSKVGSGQARVGDWATIDANASYLYDGFRLVLTDWTLPAYIGFDLTAGEVDGDLVDMSNRIYIGQTNETVASLQTALHQGPDEDFRIAAPIPEPATMLLFGVGLTGLAGVNRRRKK